MDCARAAAVLLSDVVDSRTMVEARHHIRSCPSCSGGHGANRGSEVLRHVKGRNLSRVALGLLGALQLTLALPWLMGIESWWGTHAGVAALHLSRDGMISLVLALAALVGAFSRRLAWFSISPAVVTVVVQILTSILDHHNDDVTFSFEWIHLIGVLVVLLLMLEVRPIRTDSASTGR